MKRRALLFFFLTGFSSAAFSSAELRLEGIVVDPQSPSGALAVINGQPLRTGDFSDGYTVVSISEQTAVLKNVRSGEEQILKLEAAPPAPAAAVSSSDETAARNPAGGAAFIKNLLAGPGQAVSRFRELKALRELAIINNAAVAYFNQRRIFPEDFETLIKAGLLPASYKTGMKDPYQFRFRRALEPEAFGVHADPVQKDSKLRHFFVGVDAVIREASGGPASNTSLPHDY